LITERPIRFVFRRTVVKHVRSKPCPHWVTLHAVVAVFSDYSRHISHWKRWL